MSTIQSASVAAAVTVGWVAGWLCGLSVGGSSGRRAGRPSGGSGQIPEDWRRSFSHENINRPSGPPPLRFDTGRVQRTHGNAEATTPKPSIIPKPQPSGGRLIGPGGYPVGYQPRPSSNGDPNQPPRHP